MSGVVFISSITSGSLVSAWGVLICSAITHPVLRTTVG